MNERIEMLQQLLADPSRAAEMQTGLAEHPWDSDQELVLLTREQLCRVLEAFLAGKVDAACLELWADVVEGRDDIGRESSYEALLNDAVHYLANPATEGSLTTTNAGDWLKRLRA